MAVEAFVGAQSNTRFTYLEYHLLLLCLAGVMCMALMAVEVTLSRFQVLPLIFPGMFSVRERRFYFFSFDISDGSLGKRIRADAKMLIRMTLCIVLSYLWQHCVLETTQQVGTDFPTQQCLQGSDCFASKLHFMTLVDRQYEAVNCERPSGKFSERVVVSCIKIVPPAATKWLMHLAIAHSVTQLNFKCYELAVWIAGNSKWVRHFLGMLVFVTLVIFVGLFFGDVMSEFVSSWLSFVMSLSIPLFLYIVWTSGNALEVLWKEESMRVQSSIEEHLNCAFVDIEAEVTAASEEKGVLGHQIPRLQDAHKGGKSYRMKIAQVRKKWSKTGVRSLFRKSDKEDLDISTSGRDECQSPTDGSEKEKSSPARPLAKKSSLRDALRERLSNGGTTGHSDDEFGVGKVGLRPESEDPGSGGGCRIPTHVAAARALEGVS